jgi:hypothetical protein
VRVRAATLEAKNSQPRAYLCVTIDYLPALLSITTTQRNRQPKGQPKALDFATPVGVTDRCNTEEAFDGRSTKVCRCDSVPIMLSSFAAYHASMQPGVSMQSGARDSEQRACSRAAQDVTK